MFQLGQKCFAFPLGATQYGIQQRLGPRLFQLVGAPDCFTDGGVGRDARVEQLIEADQQQCLDIGIDAFEGLLQEFCRQCGQSWLPASSTEGQVLSQTAITGLDFVQLGGQ